MPFLRKSSNDEELSPLFRGEKEDDVEKWDLFEDPPIKIESGSMEKSKWIDSSVKAFKLFAYIITFAVVLGAGVISKGTLLFMTSQTTINHTRPFCNQKLDKNQQFTVTLPRLERTAWIWMLMFTYFVPEFFTFIRSMRKCLFKTWWLPSIMEAVTLFITESLTVIGSALLVFYILPDMDVVRGAMLTNAVCFVPAVMGFFARNPTENLNTAKVTLDILSILAQATCFIIWPMFDNRPVTWLIPISVILISCGWWENYLSEDSPLGLIAILGKTKKNFENSRYFIYIFLSIWKCLLFFISMIVIVRIREGAVDFLFNDFYDAFHKHDINITHIKPVIGERMDYNLSDPIISGGTVPLPSNELTPVWVFLINILASFTCYAFGKFACKILIQGFGFAFPLNLTMPTTISLLIAMIGVYNGNTCAYEDIIPSYLFFNSPSIYFLHDFIANQHSWIWLLWLLSQTWVTVHIWKPRCEKLARTEKLFVKPMYDAFLIDQSIALNRRRDDMPKMFDDNDNDSDSNDNKHTTEECGITKIYACGTMWHETKEEMMEFLKSIIRLDQDQCARYLVKTELEFENLSDYYEIETHIFFDDAFLRKHTNDNDPTVNEYVKTLVMAVNDAASEVHEAHIKIDPPKKCVTPYGGRLVWTLPGRNKMYAHLKDKKKIRPKKRWSQVMYMYYLLGYRLMEREDLNSKQKDMISKNTYILALDGDIDFQPDAVRLLVDLMKKNKGLGAACGRIHPIGSGPMVWYQIFEYAVGHWLQKATEHMIGCVLCSPGCFSLFKAAALMDYSVMKKYTTRSEEARHFVQYDQGEDRWLCTLLLQQGYKVEYSAASDAFTHCPEGFNEFYNQRRRWMPSTTANVMDLLMNYKRTIKINDNISQLYIVYQIVLMIGTILGPGTIFLMLIGAFVAAFQMDQWSSFLWNGVPILLFMMICILFKSDVQLFFAGVLSAVYSLVMMAVLVGVMLQISNDGVLAPSSLFFFCIAGEMIITALLHPKELHCLLYGVVYYITVPSMYMILVIYSVFNLNNISWGTREVTVTDTANEPPKEITDQERKKSDKTLNLFENAPEKGNSSTFEFISRLFSCSTCTHNKESQETVTLKQINDNLQKLSDKLDNISQPINLEEPQETKSNQEINKKVIISDIINVEPNNWLDEKELGNGQYESLSSNEKRFWEDLLARYLEPVEDNKKKVAKELKDLRDKSVMAFFMINALFVLIIFLLTLKKDLLHVKWPLDVKANFTYYDDLREIKMDKQYLQLEPIGFVFLIFFFALLVVQFVAMLFHRFGTFSQILSTTYINWKFYSKVNRKTLTEDEILARNPVKVVKELMKLKDDDEEEKEIKMKIERRKTVKHLDESGKKKQPLNDLPKAFERRTGKYLKLPTNNKNKQKAMAIDQRRKTVHMRRASTVQFNLVSNVEGQEYINLGFESSEVDAI